MILRFCEQHAIRVEKNVSLARHTTFRIGGDADLAVFPDTSEKAALLMRFFTDNNVRYFILGKGSDILADDEGYRGVLLLTEDLRTLSRDGTELVAGAGCSMASVSNFALREGLAGLEFLHGIPGSIGGGVFMNAGAYGSEICDYIESVEWADTNGILHRSSREELDFSYRHSAFEENGGLVCSVVLRCHPGESEHIVACMQDLDARRREKQPLEFPSAGSAFKRPEGYYAGKLIEDCGLKGFHIGDAYVSEKHAGFIVNKGSASSEDVHRLIDHVVETVRNTFGVTLEPEIRFLEH